MPCVHCVSTQYHGKLVALPFLPEGPSKTSSLFMGMGVFIAGGEKGKADLETVRIFKS